MSVGQGQRAQGLLNETLCCWDEDKNRNFSLTRSSYSLENASENSLKYSRTSTTA